MPDFVRLASIVEESIVDGPGLRFVIFTQGCPHRCRACHNPETFLSVAGQDFAIEEILAMYKKHPLCRGITFSGGEPFLHAAALAKLAREIHNEGDDVITYTGYCKEQLDIMTKEDEAIKKLLSETDLLIDGPFVLARRSLEFPFVGSLNQRMISLSEKGNLLLKEIEKPKDAPCIKQIYWQK